MVLKGEPARGREEWGSSPPGMTVMPFSTTLTVLPRTVISKWFHSPTGLSAWVRGVTAARTSAGVFRSIRTLYISPEPIGQHQMLTWYMPSPRKKTPESASGSASRSSLPADVPGMGAVRQNVGNVLVDEGRLLEPPIKLQDEVAVFALAPERLVALRFAAGVIIDDAIDDLPVAVVALGHFPAGQVLAVEKGNKALGRGRRTAPGGNDDQNSQNGKRQGTSFHDQLVPIMGRSFNLLCGDDSR